jgi:DNA polymerase III alpha subunit
MIDAYSRHQLENWDVIEALLVNPAVDLTHAVFVDAPKYNRSVQATHSDFALVEEIDAVDIAQFHQQRQKHWHMPDQYHNMDIAAYVVDLCETDAQLARVAEELILFQDQNLFELLKYLKYLVDVIEENRIVCGVGRGSSVASYVLYLLGVHRIDSMRYGLDIREFLREENHA